MPILPRDTRERLGNSDAEYQRLAQEHSHYAAQLEQLSKSPYLSSEDIIHQITLKKLKLRVKDQMEQLASQLARASVRD
jgi:uncharacterized protein YdcH (DUF465 family)